MHILHLQKACLLGTFLPLPLGAISSLAMVSTRSGSARRKHGLQKERTVVTAHASGGISRL